MEILPSFQAAYRKLVPELQDAIDEAVKHFIARSNENALQVEKKVGLKGVWAFRVTRGYRAFFTQTKDAEGRTINRLYHVGAVGAHDDYRTVVRNAPAAPKPVKKSKVKGPQRSRSSRKR